MSDLTEHKFKVEFKKWAKGKTIDQIADKVFEAVSVTYDLTRNEFLKIAFDIIVREKFEK